MNIPDIHIERDIRISVGGGRTFPYDSADPGFERAFIGAGDNSEMIPLALITGTLYQISSEPPYVLCTPSAGEAFLTDHPAIQAALANFQTLASGRADMPL